MPTRPWMKPAFSCALLIALGACGRSNHASSSAGTAGADADGGGGAGGQGAGGAGGGGGGAARDAGGSGAGAPGSTCVPTPPGQWVATTSTNAPTPGDRLLTIWTGKLLLIFSATDGGVFDPCANLWRRASIDGMPSQLPLYNTGLPYAPIVAGDRIVVLFPASYGDLAPSSSTIAAAVYDLGADRWTTLPLGGAAPAPRERAAVAWTGTEVIVWGGSVVSPTLKLFGDGARLDPSSGHWTPIASAGAPAPRTWASSLWTGSRFVVMGGDTQEPSAAACGPNGGCGPAAPGGTYDPVTDTWAPHPVDKAPVLGPFPMLSWNGTRLVVWQSAQSGAHGIYDPAANRWETMPEPTGLLTSSRQPYRAWLDGDRFVVVETYDAAAILNLSTSSWMAVPAAQLPPTTGGYAPPTLGGDRLLGLIAHANTAGVSAPGDLQGGWLGRIDAQRARWEVAVVPVAGSPASIVGTMVWTGEQLVVWGGPRTVLDPTGSNGCEHAPPGVGCDPIVPTKRVYDNAGGLLTAVFTPAPPR